MKREFDFISHIKLLFNNLNGVGAEGIGDDCAVIPTDNSNLLVTTDMLVEDIHFICKNISPEQLGYKSLAVNLSDIAAMGAVPIASFLSVAFPSSVGEEYAERFMKGYYELSAKYGVPLLGGDTSASPDKIVINVGVIGKSSEHICLRSHAQAGDDICVTGNLGDSAGGLKIFLQKVEQNSAAKYLTNVHNRPEPRLCEGQFLAATGKVGAMMDISDGIASDLKHILNSSIGVGATIDLDSLPISAQLREVCSLHKWDYIECAVAGGEDYELLFTLPHNEFDNINREYQKCFNKPLYRIGKIDSGEPTICWKKGDLPIDICYNGFEHF